jgi:hypothetical protein
MFRFGQSSAAVPFLSKALIAVAKKNNANAKNERQPAGEM